MRPLEHRSEVLTLDRAAFGQIVDNCIYWQKQNCLQSAKKAAIRVRQAWARTTTYSESGKESVQPKAGKIEVPVTPMEPSGRFVSQAQAAGEERARQLERELAQLKAVAATQQNSALRTSLIDDPTEKYFQSWTIENGYESD